jgi:hypothetical protein
LAPGLRLTGGLHKYLRYGFIENLDTVRHIPLGQLWGVRLSVTPLTGLFPFIFFALRLGLGALGTPLKLPYRIYDAGLFVLAVALATLLHALGHILGGLLVRSPMDELLFTATRGVNLYHGDQAACPSYVHLGRSLGGPALNLAAAAVLWGLVPRMPEPLSGLLDRLAGTNLFFGAGGLLPLPSVDGYVIWREVGHWVRGRLLPFPPA